MGSNECKRRGRSHTSQYPQLTLKEPIVHSPAETYLAITITINTVFCIISFYPAMPHFNFNLEKSSWQRDPTSLFPWSWIQSPGRPTIRLTRYRFGSIGDLAERGSKSPTWVLQHRRDGTHTFSHRACSQKPTRDAAFHLPSGSV